MTDAPLVALIYGGSFCVAVYRLAGAWEKVSTTPHDSAAPLLLDVDIPEDLMALAMTYSEPWAQEDTLKAIRERYEQLQDWNRVRSAFGVGSIG